MEKKKFGLITLLESTQDWWTKLRRRRKLQRRDCLVVGLKSLLPGQQTFFSEWLDTVEDLLEDSNGKALK